MEYYLKAVEHSVYRHSMTYLIQCLGEKCCRLKGFSPNSYVKALTLSTMLFGDGAFGR